MSAENSKAKVLAACSSAAVDSIGQAKTTTRYKDERFVARSRVQLAPSGNINSSFTRGPFYYYSRIFYIDYERDRQTTGWTVGFKRPNQSSKQTTAPPQSISNAGERGWTELREHRQRPRAQNHSNDPRKGSQQERPWVTRKKLLTGKRSPPKVTLKYRQNGHKSERETLEIIRTKKTKMVSTGTPPGSTPRRSDRDGCYRVTGLYQVCALGHGYNDRPLRTLRNKNR